MTRIVLDPARIDPAVLDAAPVGSRLVYTFAHGLAAARLILDKTRDDDRRVVWRYADDLPCPDIWFAESLTGGDLAARVTLFRPGPVRVRRRHDVLIGWSWSWSCSCGDGLDYFGSAHDAADHARAHVANHADVEVSW